MTVGERIAFLRRAHGFTQEQLAEKLNTTRQAISKWEGGKATPDLDTVIRICQIFDVSLDYLLLGLENATHCQVLPERREERSERQGDIHRLFYNGLIILGSIIIALLPLFAHIYRNILWDFSGRVHTNPYLYLLEFPLICVVILGVALIIIGVYGKKNLEDSGG